MNKMIMNRLTMLAVTLMASMACFAQGKLATSIPGAGLQQGDKFDYMGVKYEVITTLGTGNVYSTKAIGFETNLLNNFDLMDTEPLNNTLTIQHYVAPSGSSFGMLVQSVEANAFQTVDADLAVKIKTLLIDDHSDNSLVNGEIVALPTTGSTFAGLTGLKTIDSHIPGESLQEISEDTFAENVYNKATLIVPEGSLKEYNGTDFWSYFYKVTDGDHIKGDVDGDNKVNAWDFQLILEAFLYNDPYDPLFDLDGDGKITAFDAQLVLDIFKVY